MNYNLYLEKIPAIIDLSEIKAKLKEFNVSIKQTSKLKIPANFAEEFTQIRIKNFLEENSFYEKENEEFIQQEKIFLQGSEVYKLKEDYSNVYAGYHLAKIFSKILNTKYLIVILTSRLFATFDIDLRYHLRTFITFDNIIMVSTTGLIEAPARPREYYLKQLAYQKLKSLGGEIENFSAELMQEFKDKILVYDDTRINKIIPGIILQGVYFLETLQPFCLDKNCILFNAHSQEELLYSQLKGTLCGKHNSIVRLQI